VDCKETGSVPTDSEREKATRATKRKEDGGHGPRRREQTKKDTKAKEEARRNNSNSAQLTHLSQMDLSSEDNSKDVDETETEDDDDSDHASSKCVMQSRNTSVTQIKRVRMENQVRACNYPSDDEHGMDAVAWVTFFRIPGLPNTTENVK
jgi:hypothetical protein